MNKEKKKLLMFGGSFDPPHLGHKAMVEAACSLIHPDLVMIVPCYIQPLKIKSTATAEQRMEMTRLMFDDKKYVISDHEIKRGGTSYTIDTLKYLERTYKGYKIFLLIGEDSYFNFVEWKSFEEILKNYNVVVVARQGKGLRNKFPFAKFLHFVTDFSHPASSTAVRAGDFQYVGPKVLEYIKSNGLYRE
jgi:nicotinate-nucleotide adenylyltransferase